MFIDPRSKVLRHIDRLAAWERGESPAPVTVEWDLTNRCSLGCQDCHFAHTHTRGPWTKKYRPLPMAFNTCGDQADIALVTRALGELAQAGIKSVVWSGGGEPTLHPEWAAAVLRAHALGLEQGMYTLGGHLKPSEAAFLGDVATFVVVSLDAVDAETYGREKAVAAHRFQAACDGIVHLSGRKTAVGVSFLLHGQNWMRAWEMVTLARSLGATYTTFRPAIRFSADQPSQPTDERIWISDAVSLLTDVASEADVELDIARFLAYRDWRGHGYSSCEGIRLNTTITPDGRLWVCPNRRGMSDSCLGDLNEESFADIWSRHPRSFAVNKDCRVMCRLHSVNQTLAAISTPRPHEAFV